MSLPFPVGWNAQKYTYKQTAEFDTYILISIHNMHFHTCSSLYNASYCNLPKNKLCRENTSLGVIYIYKDGDTGLHKGCPRRMPAALLWILSWINKTKKEDVFGSLESILEFDSTCYYLSLLEGP